MTHRKSLVVLILLVIPFLALVQSTNAQTYTTQTITTLATSTQLSTVTVGTSTSTTTQAGVPIFSAPVTIPPTHGVCGVYFVQPFNATAGATVTGTLTADNKVDFYIMTDAAFQSWSHQVVAGGICTPGSLVLSQLGTTSYTFTTTIPTTGLYHIVVNNLSHSTVTAQLTANIASSAPSMLTILMYSTVTQPNVETITQTTVTQVIAQGSSFDTLTLIIVALIIVIVAAIAYGVTKRKRGAKA